MKPKVVESSDEEDVIDAAEVFMARENSVQDNVFVMEDDPKMAKAKVVEEKSESKVVEEKKRVEKPVEEKKRGEKPDRGRGGKPTG